MDPSSTVRVALPAAMATFLLLAMVLPTLRLRHQTGHHGFVLHQAVNPFQQLVGAGMGLFMLALLVWSVLVAVLGPNALGVWAAAPLAAGLGWLLMGLGLLLTVVAQRHMGTSWRIGVDGRHTALVTAGLFRFVRNPIFSSMLLMVTGLVLVTPSPWTVMGWFNGALLLGMQARLEEQHLLASHGAAYRAYASAVGRFVPGVGRLGLPQ